jgi:hypothetical protein
MNMPALKRSSICLAIALTMVAPHFAIAQSLPVKLPIDVGFDPLPTDGSTESDTGLGSTTPTIPKTGAGPNDNGGVQTGNPGGGRPNGNPNAVQPQNPGMPGTPGGQVPKPATPGGLTPATPGVATPGGVKQMVPVVLTNPELSCTLFTNSAHKDLLNAIDSLTKVVNSTAACSGSPSAKGIADNGNKIKESIDSLIKVVQSTDASQVNTASIDQSVTAALGAVGNLGEILNNNAFLNSQCGRQSMTTGKVLLAFNEVVSGLAPYALFAVSMNAALAPALPFVVGGAIATSGISALAKMFDKGSLNFDDPTIRNAVLQNTCQFTKVAQKVRFMQLAQSGKIEKITQELESEAALYNARFSKISGDLAKLLDYKTKWDNYYAAIQNQLDSDKADLAVINPQVTSNGSDDILMCTLAQELVNFSQDGRTFPASVFNSLNVLVSQTNQSQKFQAATLTALNKTNFGRVSKYAPKASEDTAALASCAQAARSWISGINEAMGLTTSILAKNKVALENELNQYADYRSWKTQFNIIENQKITISRVEKAMQELAKDSSIIDRSELAQRLVILKAGLFGSRGFGWGNKPRVPVYDWIDHTKDVHDKAISAFLTDFKSVRDEAFSITDTGLGKTYIMTNSGVQYKNPVKQVRDNEIADKLENLNLTTVPFGSRQHEIICQRLEASWLDWTAALDHLGSIQFFCDMIDSVLDAKMDQAVVEQCRGVTKLSGQVVSKSMVTAAKDLLVARGFKANAQIVSNRMTELQCPMPPVSVMNK